MIGPVAFAARRRRLRRAAGWTLAVTLGLPLVLVYGLLSSLGGTTAAMILADKLGSSAGRCQTSVTPTLAHVQAGQVAGYDLTKENIAVASDIIRYGTQVMTAKNVAPADIRYGLEIAVATGYQESSLTYMKGGDRDSEWFFQQRGNWVANTGHTDSEGNYITTAKGDRMLRDTPGTVRRFFLGGSDEGDGYSEPGLLDVDGWQHMPEWEASDNVQHSAYPHRPQAHVPMARELVAKLLDKQAGGNPDLLLAADPTRGCLDAGPKLGTCPPSGLAVEGPLKPDAKRVLRCGVAEFGDNFTIYGKSERTSSNYTSDHPTGRAVDWMIPRYQSPAGERLGWRIATWAQHNASRLGVTYVIWHERIWDSRSDAADLPPSDWRDYDHPDGRTDDTGLHYDHVHISVYGDKGRDVIAEVNGWGLPIDKDSYTFAGGNRFGVERSYYAAGYHTGEDFVAAEGTTVKAVSAGRVTSAGDGGAYGNLVVIDHGEGIESYYAHLSQIDVKAGQKIGRGQTVGQVGVTGNTTGPHLHLEIRRHGEPIDPTAFLADKGLNP